MFSKREKPARERKKGQGIDQLLSCVCVFFFIGFLLLGFRSGEWEAYVLCAAVPAGLFFMCRVLPRIFRLDRLLLTLVGFLCALGILNLYRLDPVRGLTQCLNTCIGVGFMIVCSLCARFVMNRRTLIALLGLAGIGLIALPLVMGREINGAKSWLTVGGRSFQPSELVKIILLLILALFLSRRKVVLSVLYAGCCLGILMLQKDLGTALLYFGATVIVIYAATGSRLLLLGSVLGGAGAAAAGYAMFSHVRTRVAIWLDPWSDRQDKGYQIVQSLIAITNGGLFGTGLGLGNATVIPEYYNDFIYSAIVHEFGWLFGIVILMVYLLIVIRGMMIAGRSQSIFDSLLALGCSAMLAIQVFVIVGGNIKLIPLTGVTLPFISYGGTSLLASLGIVGLLQGVAARNEANVREDREIAGDGGGA